MGSPVPAELLVAGALGPCVRLEQERISFRLVERGLLALIAHKRWSSYPL